MLDGASLFNTGRFPGAPGRPSVRLLRDADGPVWRSSLGVGGRPVAGVVRAESPQFFRGKWSASGWPPGELMPRWSAQQPQPADLRAREVLAIQLSLGQGGGRNLWLRLRRLCPTGRSNDFAATAAATTTATIPATTITKFHQCTCEQCWRTAKLPQSTFGVFLRISTYGRSRDEQKAHDAGATFERIKDC